MEYRVYYDIQQVAYPGWWIFAVGLLFISVGAVTFLARNNEYFSSRLWSSKFQRKVMPIYLLIFGLIGVGAGWLNYSNFAELRDTTRNGKAEVVEGLVKEFVPMPYHGHGKESFVVNGHRFSYSDYDLTKGFNQSQSHGGPIREGLQVRIAHVDGKIIKLEIPK
jgi:hypothetical protein